MLILAPERDLLLHRDLVLISLVLQRENSVLRGSKEDEILLWKSAHARHYHSLASFYALRF